MKHATVNFSLNRPWLILSLTFSFTLLFLLPLVECRFRNNHEKTIPGNDYILLPHKQICSDFNLQDFVIAVIENQKDADGAFNVQTLSRVYNLTAQLASLKRGPSGNAIITMPATGGQPEREFNADLSPRNPLERLFSRGLDNPAGLFDKSRRSVIVASGIIGPSTVTGISQAEPGLLKNERLMAQPPATREQAQAVKNMLMNNPLYAGVLASRDEKAVCIYVPVTDRSRACNVVRLIKSLTRNWDGNDKVLVTGPAVMDETFALETPPFMGIFIISALICAFIALFFLFHRSITLIAGPLMATAATVICTSGLMAGTGFKINIISSMTLIFLIPVAIMNSLHVTSEFFDNYYKFKNKTMALKIGTSRLFKPMLYANLAIIAWLITLMSAPVISLRVFGLFSAMGTFLSWILSITFIPAYIHTTISGGKLEAIHEKSLMLSEEKDWLGLMMMKLGVFNRIKWETCLFAATVLLTLSAAAIWRCTVSDNAYSWLARNHPAGITDRTANKHLGGSRVIYLSLRAAQPNGFNALERIDMLRAEVQKRLGPIFPQGTKIFDDKLNGIRDLYRNMTSGDVRKSFITLTKEAENVDSLALASWNNLANTLSYVNPANLTINRLAGEILRIKNSNLEDKKLLLARMEEYAELKNAELLDKALEVCGEFTRLSFRELVFEMETELTAPLFKKPVMLQYVKHLQSELENNNAVRRTVSIANALEKAFNELNRAPSVSGFADYHPEDSAYMRFGIPCSASTVDKIFNQLEETKNPLLPHLVTKDYNQICIWIQLKNYDTKQIKDLIACVNKFSASYPSAVELDVQWAGPAYVDLIWHDKIARGLARPMIWAFLAVAAVLMLLFRSPLYGLTGTAPAVYGTILIYGILGWAGIRSNIALMIMPVFMLSTGVYLSVIFLERAHSAQTRRKAWHTIFLEMFGEPAIAICRSTITIFAACLPLVILPLVPYRTTGWLIIAVLCASLVGTLILMPALLTLLKKKLFPHDDAEDDTEDDD